MKGLLKLSAARKANHVSFRELMVKIHSPKYTLKDVDFKPVQYGEVFKVVCRSNSALTSSSYLNLMPGESYKDRAFHLCGSQPDNYS